MGFYYFWVGLLKCKHLSYVIGLCGVADDGHQRTATDLECAEESISESLRLRLGVDA